MKYGLLLLWLTILSLHGEFAVSEDVMPKRVALVIGNAAYPDKPLVNPINDAKGMADVLTKLGFEVTLKPDVKDRAEMVYAVRDFVGRISNKSISVFYFSGHGNQYNGDNYLIPTQAKIEKEVDFPDEALGMNSILERIELENTEGVNLIFLDACRSNFFGGRSFKSSGTSKGLIQMRNPRGSLIAYATAPNTIADDSPGKPNAVYTKHLIAVLREMPQKNIFELFAEVRQRVSDETLGVQVPKEDNSLMTGNFCLALEGCEGTTLIAKGNTTSQPPVVVPVTKTVPPTGIPACSLNLKSGTTCRDRLKDGSLGPEMVIIPAGNFMMGSSNGSNDEQPVHQVSVKAFAMGKYEVTFEEYDAFAREVGRDLLDDAGWGRGKRPMINVTWHDAVAYTEWLSQKTGKNYRLPTEAEWEYAARAGTTTNYWWGNTASHEYANYDLARGKDQWKFTSPVGSFKPNPFGLYDTAGNVWEWTCSRYTGTYEGNELTCDTTSEEVRVLRGGSWDSGPDGVRSAYRVGGYPTHRDNFGGFRVLAPLDLFDRILE